jgi:hypothetical protein
VLATADEHSLSFVESLPDGNATLSFQSADKVFSRTKVVQFLAHRKNLPPNLSLSKRKLKNYKEIKSLFLAQKSDLLRTFYEKWEMMQLISDRRKFA